MTYRIPASKLVVLPLVVVLAAGATAAEGGGALDRAFGKNGTAWVQFGQWQGKSAGVYVRDLLVTRKGKLVAAGHVESSETSHFAVARLKRDGSLDSRFNKDGKAVTPFPTDDAKAYTVAMAGSGRILVGGTANDDFALARYLPNGRLDPDFGVNGRVVTPVTPSGDWIFEIKRNKDGSIKVVGSSGDRVSWARYNPDGTPDTTFAPGGVRTASEAMPGDIRDVVTQSNGKVVTAGGGDRLEIGRYDTDGTLDETFGKEGKVAFSGGYATTAAANALTLQADGKIVAVGWRQYADDVRMMFARVNKNGTRDGSFGKNGSVISDHGTALAVTNHGDSGKTVVAARVAFEFAILRLRPNGEHDTSFSGDGMAVKQNLGGALDAVVRARKIFAVGVASEGFPDGYWDFWGFLRYHR